MRFLVDQNLPPRLARLQTESGHDAVHVRDLDARSAPDSEIVDLAAAHDRAIISADTDFGALLAHTRATAPSVLLVREVVSLRPPDLVETIVDHLEVLAPRLQAGAIAAFTTEGVRVRALTLR